ncbi:MAG: homoserine O-acetyltransferase MetX [Verrucomicrobiota bacterium]
MTPQTPNRDSKPNGTSPGHVQTLHLEGPCTLRNGGRLPEVTLAYETYGTLDEDTGNAVLVCHALSGDSHVARHDANDSPGWWDLVVGPDRPIDINRYFVICPNVLGGCRGTTGPSSINPETGKPYGPDFPAITIEDMVDLQERLLDALGIDRLLAVVGGSMGGQQALAWAATRPERVRGIVAIGTTPRISSQALAFDVVARNAILQDGNFRDGYYYQQGVRPESGLAIARMIGHITYLSPESMAEKFDADRLVPRRIETAFETRFSVGSYLGHQGQKFVERFDANSYMTLTRAIDVFDLGDSRQALRSRFQAGDNAWLILSFSSDWLFPPRHAEELVEALIATNNKPVSYCCVQSECGHDAFLLPNDLSAYGSLVCGFLGGLFGRDCTSAVCADRGGEVNLPGRLFASSGPERPDYTIIAGLLAPGDSVLDLGCGSGGLLKLLRDQGRAEVTGVEISESAVISCVRKGLPVIQADLNRGLPLFLDKQFDVAVLSQTLQTVKDVERVVDELLRVGRRAIVSFPNFGYREIRERLNSEGIVGTHPGLGGGEWYNTSDLRVVTIRDFQQFCESRSIRVENTLAFDTRNGFAQVRDNPNLNADLAVFVISR